MLTFLTALGSFILFLLTLPFKSVKFLKKVNETTQKGKKDSKGNILKKGDILKKHDTALSKIKKKRQGKSNEKVKKVVKLTKKALKTTVIAIIRLLQAVLGFISALCVTFSIPMLIVLFLSLSIIGGVAGSISGTSKISAGHTYVGGSADAENMEEEENKKGYTVGNWSINQSASTAQILSMNTDQVWAYISEGRYSGKQEARDDAKINFDEARQFWEAMYMTTEVPVWVWGNEAKTEIVPSTKKITCNRNLVVFWTDFFTDLYNCSDQYVMEDIQGPNWRRVSGKKEEVSMHSYGIAFDINPATSHSESTFLPMGLNSKPYSSPDKLPYDQWRHTVCTFNSSWLSVAREYKLSWGGTWSSRFDNMHFSMPGGDTDIDKTVYINQRGEYADGG